MSLTRQQQHALDMAGGVAELPLGHIIASLQKGQLAGAAGTPNGGGFDSGAFPFAGLRTGTVQGTVAVAGTAVNTAALPAGVTPVTQWVETGPEGSAVASYSGGAGGTYSVNAAATGTVTVRYAY